MPLLEARVVRPPFHHLNGHLQTIIPSVFRRITDVAYVRERLLLADGDFLDLDWVQQGHARAVVISHGLEGSSDRHYVRGTARLFARRGWDVCAWNCRSCSGEMNWLPRFYHHADTPDLDTVVRHVLSKGYQQVMLVGFSMGGNLTLKYLGEHGDRLPAAVIGGAGFSVPCDLAGCSSELEKPGKRFYNRRFLDRIRQKVRLKEHLLRPQYGQAVDRLDRMQSLREFDEWFTAPLHGFADAQDFYRRAGSQAYFGGIARPALLCNAENDPFLPPTCYPVEVAGRHDFLHLEIPRLGGHVGFVMQGEAHTYAEMRAVDFAENLR